MSARILVVDDTPANVKLLVGLLGAKGYQPVAAASGEEALARIAEAVAALAPLRARGVEVVLVDNRGSKLPEAVRRTTLRQLEQLVRSSTSGRIVARTAPEGYAEAVTILQVDAERNLTTIDESGTVTVRKT